MRLHKIILKNIKSFREATEIGFDARTNLFIGPNGGGKSNLMNTLSWVLNSQFYRPFALQIDNNRAVLQLHNSAQNAPEPHWSEQDKPSYVWIEFEVTDEDVEGIRDYWRNKERLRETFEDMINWNENQALSKSEVMEDFSKGLIDPDAYGLKEGRLMRYKIAISRERRYSADLIPVDQNDDAIPPEEQKLYDAYLRYLTDSDLRKALQNDNYVVLPYILYSPSREPHDLSMNLSGGGSLSEITRNYHTEMQNFVFNNKGTSQLLTQIASFVIGVELVELIYKGGFEYAEKEFYKSETYKRISRELELFGFKWDIHVLTKFANTFIVVIAKLQEEGYFSVSQASSGERQLLNFIFGLTSNAIDNSLIIIDESELNLHPRWQKLLLRFFLKIQLEKNCQLVISTHSASFLDQTTLPHVRRIYRRDQASALSATHEGEESSSIFLDAVKLLSAQQNERIFFTQKAVLVEGPSDFVIWQKLINIFLEIFGIGEIVEVVEVLGSANFAKYRRFLDLFEIESYIIADLDYIGIIGDSLTKEIFKKFFDDGAASRRLAKSHSLDRASLISEIESCLESGNSDRLKVILEFLKLRNVRIDFRKLSEEDVSALSAFRESRRADGIFVLEKGALEAYYIAPDQEQGALKKDTDKAIAFTSDEEAFKGWICKGSRLLSGETLTVTDEVMAAEAAEFIAIALHIVGVDASNENAAIIRNAMCGSPRTKRTRRT